MTRTQLHLVNGVEDQRHLSHLGRRPGNRLGGTFLALALLVLFAGPSQAQATYDPLGSGTTRLTFDRSFLAQLKRDGISLSAKAPATLKAGVLTLPVPGGEMDPTIGKGTIESEGVLIFSARHRTLPFKELTLKTKHSPLLAKVGGGQLKLVTAKTISVTREGFGAAFSAKGLKLSAKVATRLNKKLRPAIPFIAHQPLGSFLSNTQPLTTTILETGKATIVLDPAIVAKLNSRFVSINPIFPAEHVGSTFAFPILFGGAISPDASLGTLRIGGDIEFLQLGGGQIFWHEPWLDLGAKSDSAEVNLQPSPPYPGKEGRIGILDYAPGSISSEPNARTISVAGAKLTLQAGVATAFNRAFAEGKEAFKTGEALGTLTFTAQGQ